MPMFVEIFLLCVMAQPLFCVPPQTDQTKVDTPAENAKVDNKSAILSLINGAGNCTAYVVLKSESKYQQLKEYCERPFPDPRNENAFLSYEVVLCMVLYDTAQRVCEVGREVTKVDPSFSNFSCDAMIKGVPETSVENTKEWVTIFKTKFENISNCEQACIQDNLINPICEYILKANILTQQAQVSSTISAGTSRAKNLEHQVNTQGHGKANNTITAKDIDPPSAVRTDLHLLSNGSQNTEQVDHKETVTDNSTVHKDVDLAEENGNSTHSGSGNDMQNNVKEHAHTTGSNIKNGIKKQAHAAESNKRNDTNKQAHSTNSSVPNNVKKQEHAINSNNQSAEETPDNPAVSLSKDTERTPEGDKYDDSTGKSISSDSNSNTAPQPENKNSAGVDAPHTEIQNQNDDNEDSVMQTYENYSKVQDTDIAGYIRTGDEDQEEGRVNSDHQGEQSEQIPKEIDTHQEETETGNTAQFNQLGDPDNSHFYAYFMTMVVICIVGYVVFHNKQKILALALEGRSRRGTRRRPNTSAYRKLDSNLEEAVTSTCSTSVTHVIY